MADFEICRTLGTGSYGRVLLAKHRPTGRFCALKKLRKPDIIRLRQVEHTNNECRLLTAISSIHNIPFIVGLRGKFQDAACLYLVLDYVPGGELFSLLRKLRTLPVFVAQFYAAQVAYALASLHDHGIIYRDLKPENLLLNRSGYLRMADFGFAKELPIDNPITWTFCGTPEYLAPEIIASNGYGPAVDWWALGILIYEMLTGHPPFYHENHLKLYDLIAQAPLRFPDSFDYAARDLVTKLLDRIPTKRLGVLVNGPQDVLNHPWFRGIDWEKLASEQIRPPFKPKVANDGDASNFDSYPEEASSALSQYTDDPAYERFPDFPVIN
jgi:serine/threonine protein kinase